MAVLSDEEQALRWSASSSEEEQDEESWPFWKLALIALPQLGVMVLWIFLGQTTTPYAKSLGASESFATLNSAGPIVGFVVGPIVGTWSDQSTSKWGRRRPIIVAGLVSTIVAGLLYAGAKHIMTAGKGAIYLAGAMQWVLDFTINAMQTPFRALVSDLASPQQQLPMQIFFEVVVAAGCLVAFSMMKIYAVAVHHMLELMILVLLVNTVCIGLALCVAREKQYVRPADQQKSSACGTLRSMSGAFKGMPRAFYILLFVQCMVWLGNAVWGSYGQVWFTRSVYPGNAEATGGSAARLAYVAGEDDFSSAGQIGSIFTLFLSFTFMCLGYTSVPNNWLYSVCLFVGALVCFMCAFVVGQSAPLAILCFVLSNVGLTAAGSIPYGIVAVWNKAAEAAGNVGSVAMQMAILNCCVTVGQQCCTMILGGFEEAHSVKASLTGLFTISMVANVLAGVGALFLTSDGGKPSRKPASATESEGEESPDTSESE